MINLDGLIKYSSSNPYAKDYYAACKNFTKVRSELAACEHKNNIDVSEYNLLKEKCKEYKAEIPKIINQANAYENNIKENIRKEQYNSNGSGLQLYINA